MRSEILLHCGTAAKLLDKGSCPVKTSIILTLLVLKAI